MIKGKCTTYIDEAKRKKWPTVFVAVPEIGSIVRAKDGYKLKVHNIVYYEVALNEMGFETANNDDILEPRIEVELTKPLTYQT